MWRPFWDLVFGASSALLALLYGVALGNVVRGVPLDSDGYFFLPLWTNLLPGAQAGVVDWYTLLIGLAALVALWPFMAATGWCLETSGDLQAPNPILRREGLVGAGAVHRDHHAGQLPAAAEHHN